MSYYSPQAVTTAGYVMMGLGMAGEVSVWLLGQVSGSLPGPGGTAGTNPRLRPGRRFRLRPLGAPAGRWPRAGPFPRGRNRGRDPGRSRPAGKGGSLMPRRIPYARPPGAPMPFRTEDKSERDQFYGSSAWTRLRKIFLACHPLCEECARAGRGDVEATIVHHKIERLNDPSLALDWENLESSCSPCHTRRHKSQRPNRS